MSYNRVQVIRVVEERRRLQFPPPLGKARTRGEKSPFDQ
jgi:hypothetical protein